MENINFATREVLLRTLLEKEVDEVIHMIKEANGRLTQKMFLKQTTLSRTKISGIINTFQFYPESSSTEYLETQLSTGLDKVTSPEIKEETHDQATGTEVSADAGEGEKFVTNEKMMKIMDGMRLSFETSFEMMKNCLKEQQEEIKEQNSKSQKAMKQQIEGLENRIKVVESGDSKLGESSDIFLSSMKQKQKEYLDAMDTYKKVIQTDMAIFRKETKDIGSMVQKMTSHLASKEDVVSMDKEIHVIQNRVSDISCKVERIENANADDTVQFIDNVHVSQMVSDLETSLTDVKKSQQSLQKELTDIRVSCTTDLQDIRGQIQRIPGRSRREEDGRYQQQRQQIFKTTPKLPYFDGSTRWKTFFGTFSIHSQANHWNEEEKYAAIQLCFRDKAVNYLRSQQALGRCNDFNSLVSQMSKRFEKQQDPFVKRSEFYALCQEVDESVEEWADRVLDKAMEAFEQAEDDVREEEMVRRFTMGCLDKEAAHYVINSKPRNLDMAIQTYSEYKENASLIYGKKKHVRQVSFSEEEQAVRAISQDRRGVSKEVSAGSSPRKGENTSQAIVKALEIGFEKMLLKLDDHHKDTKKMLQERRSRSPERGACFICGGKDHWMDKCSKRQRSRSPSRESNTCFSCGESGHQARECTNSKANFNNKYSHPIPSFASPSVKRAGERVSFSEN